MAHYRKKPVVVWATQWWANGDHPEVLVKPLDPITGFKEGYNGWVQTLEGGHVVTPGDWIITGVHGEHYPCKPDIFKKTYERA